jgi:pyridoxine 5-phosphate synthase
MTKLSVNINKFATLRNARGGNIPDVLKTALDCERYGAEGITIHPSLTTEFNIEGNPIDSFTKLVIELKPAQVTLVPDSHDAITSNNGWDTKANKVFLKEICRLFQGEGIRTSIFVNADVEMIKHASDIGCDRVELYTESYATEYFSNREAAIEPFVKAAIEAQKVGLGLNAGHDLNLENLNYFFKNIPGLLEVSIGHALICDAIYLGLENTIQSYIRQLKIY